MLARLKPNLWLGFRPHADRPSVNRIFTEFRFDAEQAVVFRDALAAAERTGFDLTGTGGDGKIRDRRVFGFARSVADYRAIAVTHTEIDRLQGFRQRTDLIDLDQDRVRRVFINPRLQTLRIGDKQIITDELAATAHFRRQSLPVFPVLFVQAIFDRDDRILAG